MAKSLLKKILRITARLLLGLFAFILLYILAVFVCSAIPVNRHATAQGDIPVYINSNGVHTDIVVPVKNEVKDWSKDILFSHTRANDTLVKYVAFGWGDKGFYLHTPQWSDLKASTAFKAAFNLGTSAMHTKFYRSMKEDKDCVKIGISKEDYRALVTYIESSFALNAERQVCRIGKHCYGDYDAFYEANRKYNLFYTCNTWANNALKAANQKAALWTTSDKGILWHYKK